MPGGLKVLSQCQHVDAVTAKIIHAALDFILRLAKAQHKGSLGNHIRAVGFAVCQDIEGLLIAGPRVSHRMSQSLHSLHILRKYLDTRVQQGLNGREVAQKIGRQCLHRSLGIDCLGRSHHRCVMTGTAIGQIVTVDRGQHHVAQTH